MSDSFQLIVILEHAATSINCTNHHVATIVEQPFLVNKL